MAKVLIVGSGAREHALAQTFLRSSIVSQVYVAPGNDGMTDDNLVRLEIQANATTALIETVKNNHIDLTFVGNEEPLTLGIVDCFQEVFEFVEIARLRSEGRGLLRTVKGG